MREAPVSQIRRTVSWPKEGVEAYVATLFRIYSWLTPGLLAQDWWWAVQREAKRQHVERMWLLAPGVDGPRELWSPLVHEIRCRDRRDAGWWVWWWRGCDPAERDLAVRLWPDLADPPPPRAPKAG